MSDQEQLKAELEDIRKALEALQTERQEREGEKADWELYEEACRLAQRARTEVEILGGKIARTHLAGSVPLGWEVAAPHHPAHASPAQQPVGVPYGWVYVGPGGSSFAPCTAGPGGSSFAPCTAGPGGSSFAPCTAGPGGSSFCGGG